MSNRSAIGVRLAVTGQGLRPQAQEVQNPPSFLSCNDRGLNFGVGRAEQVDLRVRWPSGKWNSPQTLRTN